MSEVKIKELPKILIAVPCMDTVDTGFCKSLISLVTMQRVGVCGCSFLSSSLIYDSRNNLALKALDKEADYVLWLDSDIVFEHDLLERLMATMNEEQADIVSGLYFKRVPPFSPIVYPHFIVDEKKGLASFLPYEGELKGRKSVDAVGFGCVLMKTEVFKKILEKYTDLFSHFGQIGEDLSFCWRAKEVGCKIICDMDIKVGHIGSIVVDESFYKGGEA